MVGCKRACVAPICHQKWISWVGDGSENPQDIAQAWPTVKGSKYDAIHTELQFSFYKYQLVRMEFALDI